MGAHRQTVALWDYATADPLQGDGSAPLNVYFRIAPDMYYTERPNAVLRLAYRYNSIPIGPISSMQVRVNNAFLGSVPLIPGQEASRKMQLDVPVPVVNLRPFSNSLSFDFTFQLLKKASARTRRRLTCRARSCVTATWICAAIRITRRCRTWRFSRMRDFRLPASPIWAKPQWCCPPTPTEQEIETFVTMMGHFSRQTGYPGLRVTVPRPDAMAPGAKSDFLVIGTGDDQPGFDKLGDNLPVTLHSGRIQVHDTQGFFATDSPCVVEGADADEQANPAI